MSTTKIEFAVNMTCDSCVTSVKDRLKTSPGIRDFQVELKTQTVIVDTTLRTEEVQKLLESTGRKVVVKGYAGSEAGVVVLDSGEENVQGVVRLIQINAHTCIYDGTIDGLKPGTYRLTVHECGDVSEGCESVGDVYDSGEVRDDGTASGILGNIRVDSTRATFRIEDSLVKLCDIIGRSLVVEDETGRGVVCGVIARSAGLFENPKTICACDGVSIWDESSKPKL